MSALKEEEETMPTRHRPPEPINEYGMKPSNRFGSPVSRRTAIRLGTSTGGALLIGTSMGAGIAAGQPEEEEEEMLGLFTKVKNKVAEFDKGVIIEFDGDVASGEPDEGEYLEGEVEVEPAEKGVIIEVKAGDSEATLELTQEPPEIGLFVTFDSEIIGALVDSEGRVTDSGAPDDVAEKGVIIEITMQGIGTTPGIVALDVAEANGSPDID